MWTVSAIQQHRKSMIVCDDDATSELKVKTVQYFRYTYCCTGHGRTAGHTAALLDTLLQNTNHCGFGVNLMIVTVVVLARCCVLAVCGYTRLLGLERHLTSHSF